MPAKVIIADITTSKIIDLTARFILLPSEANHRLLLIVLYQKALQYLNVGDGFLLRVGVPGSKIFIILMITTSEALEQWSDKIETLVNNSNVVMLNAQTNQRKYQWV